jgi:tRNA G18 (ribose-2'-O)-methylase SpoU
MPQNYTIRLCQNPACGLRYPLTEAHPFGTRCPLCLGETRPVFEAGLPFEAPPALAGPLPGRGFYALLDNVRSAWNVGAIFRTADGFGVEKLHLCGITPTPQNESVKKTALGAEKTVAWEHSRNALQAASDLKSQGWRLWALEQDSRSSRDFRFPPGGWPRPGLVLIVGSEVTGVDPGLLDLCERIVEIPMLGSKRSLNVEVAFGIAAHTLLTVNPQAL